MADYKEIRVERLFLKVPNTEKLRKGAAGRHKHLLADGWREVERRREIDHIWVRYERTGPTRSVCGCPGPRRTRGASSAVRAWAGVTAAVAAPAAGADRPTSRFPKLRGSRRSFGDVLVTPEERRVS